MIISDIKNLYINRSLSSYYGVLKWCDGTRLWYKYYYQIYPILKKYNYTIKIFRPHRTRRRERNGKNR